MGRSHGEPLTFTARTLHKWLHEKGFLVTTDCETGRETLRDRGSSGRCGRSERYVLVLRKGKVPLGLLLTLASMRSRKLPERHRLRQAEKRTADVVSVCLDRRPPRLEWAIVGGNEISQTGIGDSLVVSASAPAAGHFAVGVAVCTGWEIGLVDALRRKKFWRYGP